MLTAVFLVMTQNREQEMKRTVVPPFQELHTHTNLEASPVTCVMGNKPFLMVITCRIPFMQHSRNDRTVELETRLVVAGGLRRKWGWEGSGCGHKRDPGGQGNPLDPEYLSVLPVILYYGFARC